MCLGPVKLLETMNNIENNLVKKRSSQVLLFFNKKTKMQLNP